MKLRIVEDLSGCGNLKWFVLQKWDERLKFWSLVISGSDESRLREMATRLLTETNGDSYVVRETFESPPANLIDSAGSVG